MRTVCVVQARIGGTRLPGKVLELIGEYPALYHTMTRAEQVLPVIAAIPDTHENDELEQVIRKWGYEVVRGPEDDVLTRYIIAAEGHDRIVRVTGDCPFVNYRMLWSARRSTNAFWCNNSRPFAPVYWGLDVESFTTEYLLEADQSDNRDDPCWWMREQTGQTEVYHIPGYRWTLDTPEDLKFFRTVAEHINVTPPHLPAIGLLSLLEKEPWIGAINC